MINNWDRTFMNIAREFAKHSTCCRKQVGAVIVSNGRIVSTGYNGVPSGIKHCNQIFTKSEIEQMKDLNSEAGKKHAKFSREFELHAEQNCIAFASKTGIKLDNNSTLYTTLSPCSDCAKLISQSGIKRVVYEDVYDRDHSGIDLLNKLRIVCEKIDDKGDE